MASSQRSRLHLAFCRISEEIYGTNGESLFFTRGCGCLVKSKELKRSLHAKSKVFLVTTVEVLDIQYLELQLKQNNKFKIIAEFLKTNSSTVFETYDLNESLFGSLSDVYVVNGVTFIALTRVDKWYMYLGLKSIVSSRPLDVNFKNFDSKKSKEAFCYVLLEAIGNHMKGFTPRSYELKYTIAKGNLNFFLMRKGDSHQSEKYVHSIRRFDENEVGRGAVILNEKEEFIGVVRYKNDSVLPVKVEGIFCKDTEPLEACCEDYSDPNARELDESSACSQPMNNTTSQSLAGGDKIEVEISKGSAIAEDSPLRKHVKISNILSDHEIAPDDKSDSSSKTDNLDGEANLLCSSESVLSKEGLPRSQMTPPEEQRGTGEEPGGSTNALTFTRNGGANDGSDLVWSSGTTEVEDVNAPPEEQKYLIGIGLQSQSPYGYDASNEAEASIDFSHTKNSNSNSDSQNGALANRTLSCSKGTSCAGSQQSNRMINTDDEMEDDNLVEKSHTGIRSEQRTGPSTANPSSPNVSLLDSATRQKLPSKSTLDSGYNLLSARSTSFSRIDNKPRMPVQRQTSTTPKSSSLPYSYVSPRIVWENRSMSYYNLHANQASGYTVEHLTNNLDCMETLSRLLDTEYKLSLSVKHWKHLADKLGMPKELRDRISRISKYSPSEDFFEYLFATKPDLILSEFISALITNGRRDVWEKILQPCVDEKKLNVGEPFNKLCDQIPDVLSKMAIKLDQGAYDYKDIASSFDISIETVRKWGRDKSYNPTKDLLIQLKCKKPWITNETLKRKLQGSNRPEAIQLLSKFSDKTTIGDIFDDVETMDKFCEHFNAEIPGTWNYRNLATAFKLPYDSFAQDPQDSLSSPTEYLFEWLQGARPNFPAYNIIIKLADIQRIDVLKALHKFFPEGYVENALLNKFGHQWIKERYMDDE